MSEPTLPIPPNKKGRLIIRNLVFDINEKHLRGLFTKYGEITEISLPINPSTNKPKGFAFIQFDNKNHALKAIKELNGTQFKGRTILLDLAFEKTQYAKLKQNNKPNQEEEKPDDNEHEQIISDEEKEDDKMEEEEDENNMEEEEENGEEQEKEKAKTKEPETFETTIFVSNIAFDTDEKQFVDFFKKYGEVTYGKLVKNRETGDNKGTGFIKFSSPSAVPQLLTLSASSSANELELNGRRIYVKQAVSREEVAQKSEKEKKEGEKMDWNKVTSLEDLAKLDRSDRRKLRLAVLGVRGREEEEWEKIDKLRNPNNFVSETRILMKHLPKRNFDEKAIKEIIKNYLAKKYDAKILKKKKILKSIKMVKEKEKLDENNKPASKGICFIEFMTHDDALQFLNHFAVPSNYSLFNPKRPPTIEFSIEDIRKQQKIEKKIKSSKENQLPSQKSSDSKQKSQKTHTYKLMIEKILEEEGGKEEEVQGSREGGDKEEGKKKKEVGKKKKKVEGKEKGGEMREESLSKVKEYLKEVKSRGIKQRLKKRIKEVFGIEEEKEKEEEIREQEERKKEDIRKQGGRGMSNEGGKKEGGKGNREGGKLREIEIRAQQVKKEVKKKVLMKRKAKEYDEFDEIAEKYEKKVQKKVKWDSQT